MVFKDYGKNGKVQDKKVDPIHQCKKRIYIPPTRLEIGIKDKDSRRKK
jgi:hypothetical protein